MPSANGGGKMEQSKKKQAKRAEIWKKQLGVENSDDFRRTMGPALAEAGDRHDNNVPTKKRKESEKKEKVMDNSSQSNFPEDNADVYKDSSTFLKGTQSMNPHNDYCQNYVDTGERPQNFIRDVGLTERFGEYPKLKDLIRLKDEVIRKSNTPPTYLKADLRSFNLRTMGAKFDVILIEPPLEEYKKVAGLPITKQEYNWEEIGNLDIPSVCGPRSFIFLWCGSSDGLDHGRRCLKRWGYRRCEDICWIKTNLKQKKASVFEDSIFVRTKEHCLMGIRGTVRRSLDGDFIHANVDIDLIIAEECEPGSDEKPEEIFHIIEHFCLGRRRLHLFGKDLSIRPGWLTVGPQLTTSNFDKLKYSSNFEKAENNTEPLLSGSTEEIERLRPKTPPPREKKQDRNSLTSGRGGGMQSGGRGGGMQSGGRGGGMQSGGVGRNNRMGGAQNNNGRTQASPQNQQQQKDVNNQSSNHQMMGPGGRRTATDHRQAVPANGGGAVGFHERGGSVDARGPRNRNGSWDSRTSGSRPRTMGGYKGPPHQGNTPEFRS